MSDADQPAERHQRPVDVSDDTVEALGKLSEALETAVAARGHLYEFHQLTGRSDSQLQDAVTMLRDAGHADLADVFDHHMVGRNVLEGRWTFQIVEEYDDNYHHLFQALEQQAREELVDGRRHLKEAEMKERGRTRGLPSHTAEPDEAASA